MGMGRGENMRRIRAKDTGPERVVRTLLRELGHRGYRLHRKDLPGKPDIVFVGRRKAIFVHGCFWHGHECREGVRRPKSNTGYWLPKIEGNQRRDARHIEELLARGWDVLTVWDCELGNRELLAAKLAAFLDTAASPRPVPAS
jgi:DNA mismatch endonuclease (patch repair protein)